MLSLLIALAFFAVSLGFYVVTRTLKARRQDWQALAEKRGLAFDGERFEIAGALEGLELTLHDRLDLARAAQLGASMPLGSTAVVVDVPVPSCPAGLRLRSRRPRISPRRLGGPVEVAAPPGRFEEAFSTEAEDPGDLELLAGEAVAEALLKLASTRWYRGVVLEGGTLSAFHFNPAFGSGQDAAELEQTVDLTLAAAAALREECAGRQAGGCGETRRRRGRGS